MASTLTVGPNCFPEVGFYYGPARTFVSSPSRALLNVHLN